MSISDTGNSVSADFRGLPSAAFLSVVIPVYNEASRIPSTLRQVLEFLERRPESCEVAVVDDGSTDDTVERVQTVCRESGNVRLLRHPANQGKGLPCGRECRRRARPKNRLDIPIPGVLG